MVPPIVADPEMSQEEFLMIRDFVHEKSGMFFAENKMYLVKNRLIKRMADLDIRTYKDYFYHVKYDTSLKEFNELMNSLTTNETSFFRNEPQLISFSSEVLPLVIAEKRKSNKKSIRVWSAGCSTGEEPYTLAILMLELLQMYPGFTVEVVANDISEQVLQKARKGQYSGLTLRNLKPDMQAKYFTKVGDIYRVNSNVKSLVKFSHMNFNDPRKIAMNTNFDVVFCRNVMIYFSDEVKKQLVRGFFNSLVPGGYFYIGHSETLHGVSKAFKLVYFKNALVYQKEAIASPAQSAARVGASASVASMASGGAVSGASRAMDLLKKIKPMTVKK